MKEKAFTLFTALVAFVLIVLSVVVVQSMVKAEADKLALISDIEEQSEMQAIVDLTRADAIQLFNYQVRFEIEDWLSTNGASFAFQELTWDELVEQFTRTFFFGLKNEKDESTQALTYFLSQELVKGYQYKRQVGVFQIELTGTTQAERGKVQEVLNKMLKSKESFIEVVGCEDGDPKKCIGTFYINLNPRNLSAEDYYAFPKIKVTNTRTNRVIEEPIMPRTNLRIYVPVRIFKAFAEARALAIEHNRETGTLWKQNYGIFSPRIHNELEEMRLGLCDIDSCRWREHPYLSSSEKEIGSGAYCPGDQRFATTPSEEIMQAGITCTQELKALGMCDIVGNFFLYYFPGDKASFSQVQGNLEPDTMLTEDAIKQMVVRRLCNLAVENYNTGEYLNADKDDGYILIGRNGTEINGGDILAAGVNEYLENCPLYGISISTDQTPSKVIKQAGNSVSTSEISLAQAPSTQGNYLNINYPYGKTNAGCPMTPYNKDVGVFLTEDDKITHPNITEFKCTGFTNQPKAFCEELDRITVNLRFVEKNPKYIVNKNKAETGVAYNIRLKDTFEPFNPNYYARVDTGTCALDKDAKDNPTAACNANQGWTCYSLFETANIGDMGPGGCSPNENPN